MTSESFRDKSNSMGKLKLILIAGGAFSGKQTISQSLLRKLANATESISTTSSNSLRVKTIALDREYQLTSDGALSLNTGPYSYDFDKLQKYITDLRIETEQSASFQGELVLIVHGKYALYNSSILNQATLKIFIDCDPDTRLMRSLQQSVVITSSLCSKKENDKKFRDVIDLYLNQIKPEFEQWILKTRDNADLILRNDYDRFLDCPRPNTSSSAASSNETAEDMILELLSDGVLPLIKQSIYLKEDTIERSGTCVNNLGSTISSGGGFNFNGEVFDGEKERFYDLG